MKTLNSPPKFLIHAMWKAIRHPRTPITYLYCPDCKLRFHPNEKECPKCHSKVGSSPEPRQESPIPWWGSVLVICIGIIVIVVGAKFNIPGADRLGDALVYLPLGNLFGMSLPQ